MAGVQIVVIPAKLLHTQCWSHLLPSLTSYLATVASVLVATATMAAADTAVVSAAAHDDDNDDNDAAALAASTNTSPTAYCVKLTSSLVS